MNVRTPKSFLNLPKSEKEIIERLHKEAVENEVNRYFAQLQKNWLKLSCIVMHDYMGLDRENCLLYLANFREVYRQNSKMPGEAEQQEWLDGKMDEIFGVGGYPYKYIDKLEEME